MLSTLLLAGLSSVALAAPISKIGTVTPSLLPNATQYNASVVYYEMNGNWGACGTKNEDSDKVVGLPLEFYSKLNEVSQYCGQYVVVTNPVSGENVTAQVQDASTQNNTLSVSMGTWKALNGSEDNLHYVNWRRANETEVAAFKKAQTSSTGSSSSSSWTAPSSSSSVAASSSAAASREWKAPVASSSSSAHSEEKTSTWAPSSTSSSAEKSSWIPSSSASSSTWSSSSAEKKQSSTWAPSSSSSASASAEKKAAWTPSSSSEEPKWTPSSSSSSWSSPAAKKYTPTSTWSPEPTTTTTQAPKQTQQASTSSFSGSYSGQATFYSQNGVAGSCGAVHGDYDMIAAVSAAMNPSSHCGQTATVKNTQNGKTISVKLVDTCPGCGYGSLDLSMGAFGALGDYDQGVLPITWSIN
ncbi:hypothetical protein JCM5350_000883 [Sporobolomyces pararoseus]